MWARESELQQTQLLPGHQLRRAQRLRAWVEQLLLVAEALEQESRQLVSEELQLQLQLRSPSATESEPPGAQSG